jgi:hypothetical protein
MVHATHFLAPSAVDFPGSLTHLEIVIAANQDHTVCLPAFGCRHEQLLRLAPVFLDLVEHFGHILDLFKKGVGYENRTLLRRCEREAVARTGIDLDYLPSDFVLLLQYQPGEVCGIPKLCDYNAFYGDIESFENTLHEIVRQRAFLRGTTQEHADDGAHARLDIDDEHLFIIPHKQSAPAIGGEDAPDLNRHNVILHTCYNVNSTGRKDKPAPEAILENQKIKLAEAKCDPCGAYRAIIGVEIAGRLAPGSCSKVSCSAVAFGS